MSETREYRESLWCRLFGHKYGGWFALPGETGVWARRCLRICDGSTLTLYNPWESR